MEIFSSIIQYIWFTERIINETHGILIQAMLEFNTELK